MRFSRHGRACPGHPRLWHQTQGKTLMPGTSPGMTKFLTVAPSNNRHCEERSDEAIQFSALRCYGLLRFARNDGLLRLSQQRIAAGDLDLAGRRLEIELLDHAVIDQHRIALGADAEAIAGSIELHADRLGEFGVAVSQ